MSHKGGSFALLAIGVSCLLGVAVSTAGSAQAVPVAKTTVAKTLTVKASVAKLSPVRISAAPATDANGYAWISYYRSLAGLSPVARNAKLEAQDAVHVRYLANSALSCEVNVHDEQTRATPGCRRNPAATPAGKAAANNSDVTRVSGNASDRVAVSNWFGAAFHALTLLDPRLRSTGYAAYYTPTPKGAKPLAWPFTAAADVYRGRTGSYQGQVVAFPANGSSTPLLSYRLGTESPEPIRNAQPGACRGWSSKQVVSSPVIVQWPKARGIAKGTATLVDLTTNRAQPTCALTASSYARGSLPAEFLDGTNGITKSGFYYAASPFVAGHRYQLRIGGHAITTFTAQTVPAPTTIRATVAPAGHSVTVQYRDANLANHLVQVWSGANCSGVLVTQLWAPTAGVTVTGLRSGRAYSSREVGRGPTLAGRWSGCVNFRA